MKSQFVLITAVAVIAYGSFGNPPGLISPVAAADSMPHAHMLQSPLTEAGNDAFGTIQEVIRALDADPKTDWSKVNLEALRAHLVDMNNMTLRVTVLSQQPIANGVEITIAPESAQVAASLDRVFAAHPPQLEAETGWKMTTQKQQGNYRIVVTTTKPDEVAEIRGLGYIGVLATGAHHQAHHWAMARGINPHHH